VLAFLLLTGLLGSAGADTSSQIQAQKDRLAQLEREIQDANDQLASLGDELNVLATRIDQATGVFQETQQAVMATREQLEQAEGRYESLRAQLDQRAADAYMEGPGNGLEVILGATSITDFTDRLEFIDNVTQHDSDVAVQVQVLANQLRQRKEGLDKVLVKQTAALHQLNQDQTALNEKFDMAAGIRDDLKVKQDEIGGLLQKLEKKLKKEELQAALAAQQGGSVAFHITGNPFTYCPVDQPMAFGDSFGAPRYAGGYHPHAGNDLMAPRGTPIRATFDGVAEADPNGLGGNAVIVHGAAGYTYNAHLDRYGTLGNVTAGTIVGYVGDSGDALGGPTHDHFEWHPDVMPSPLFQSAYGYSSIDSAIDPYPYLLQVC
jgi:peptidoglycan hydrolase CwlO-like protein